MENLQIESSGILVEDEAHPIENLTFSPDGRYLCATCRNWKYIWVFDLQKHQPFAEMGEFDLQNKTPFKENNFLKIQEDKIVTSVAISSLAFICVGFIDGELKLLNIKDPNWVIRLNDAHGPNENGEFLDADLNPVIVNSVKISPDGTKILSGFGNGFVRLVDGTKEERYEHKYDSPILSVLFSNKGDVFYTASKDGIIYIKDSNSFQDKGLFKTEPGYGFSTMCMSPDSKYIYAICTEQAQHSMLYLFDIEQKYQAISLDRIDRTERHNTSFSTDGKYFCACVFGHGLIFYLPNAKGFYSFEYDEGLHMWIKQAKDKAHQFFCCSFSPDGKYLFLGGKKITINLNPMEYWNQSDHQELALMSASSSTQQSIMTFFLCNTDCPKKIPLHLRGNIMKHLRNYKFLPKDSFSFF
jgi:WD40 repeat protein